MTNKIKILLLVTLFYTSCNSSKYPKSLVEIDSLCYSNPQLALTKLEQIGNNFDTTQTAYWMYYNLLKLKAQEKTCTPHPNLGKINLLKSYYERNDDKKLLPEIYYLTGTTYLDLHDSPQALEYFHKTLNECKDIRLKGLTYAQLGYIMLYQGNFSSAIDFYKKSYHIDLIRNDIKGQIYDLRDLGYTYANTNKVDSAIFFSQQSLQLALKAKMPKMITSAKSSLANIYLDSRQDVDSAAKYFLPLLNDIREENKSGTFSMAIKYYKLCNLPDSVNYYIKKIEETGDVYAKEAAYREKVEMALKKNCSYKDLLSWKLFIQYADSIENISNANAIAKSQSLYDYTQKEKEYIKLQNENKQHKLWQIIYGLTTLLTFLLFYVYYKKYKIAKNEQKRQTMELQHILEKSASQKTNNKDTLSQIKETNIYSIFIQKTQNKNNINENEWKELDELVNKYYFDFKITLYRICKLSEIEYRICLLLKVGFNLSDMATILHREPSTLSMARKRLYKKLFHKDGKAEELDIFIRSI